MAQQTVGIAVTTAPRARPTLKQSLRSLREAGFGDQVFIFSDDPDPEAGQHSVLINSPPLGNLHNFDRALRWLVGMKSDYVLMAEDDVTWARGAADALQKDLSRLHGRLFGYLSLYCPRQVAYHISRAPLSNGLHCSRLGRDTWGAQALCLPHKSAKRLLAWKGYRHFLTNNSRHRDSIIAESFKQMGMERFYRVPCLVNHDLGFENSTRGGSKNYRESMLQTDYWTGKP